MLFVPCIPSKGSLLGRAGLYLKAAFDRPLTIQGQVNPNFTDTTMIPNAAILITFINKLGSYPFVSTPFRRVLRWKYVKELFFVDTRESNPVKPLCPYDFTFLKTSSALQNHFPLFFPDGFCIRILPVATNLSSTYLPPTIFIASDLDSMILFNLKAV